MSKNASTKVEESYDASALEALSPSEQVRRRPGMWIGNTGQKGLHHLVYEIVDNSVDEFMAGHGDLIEVEVEEDGWVTVRDHARGIPVDKHKESGLTGVELVLTRIGGGGKYGQEGSGYKVSGGLHGVGSSVVNFLSQEMRANISRDGFEWEMVFARGEKKDELKKGKKTEASGTAISFLYDDEVFDQGVHFEKEILERRLRELAYLNPGLRLRLTYKGGKPADFYAEGGLSDYMKALLSDRDGVEAVHKEPLLFSGSVTEEMSEKGGKKREDTTFVDVSLFWSTAPNESWHAFTNAISNPDGGTHYDGLRSGLRRALNEAAEELGKFRAKDEPFEQVDTREGLFSAILVKVADPQFEGQTKGKLNNPEVQKRVSDFVYRELLDWMLDKQNRAQADRILARVIESRDGRLAARKARKAVTERKGLLGGSGLPGKLVDCRLRDREQTEIFLVEGDSAGGGMKKARDSNTQAVMPLRGKIQNAEKAGEATLSSQAIQDILAAIGGVITDVKVQVKKGGKMVNRTKLVVDVSEPRYGTVVIACDADDDGGHIVTLLLTFFYRYAPDLIKQGRLYIADLPLFRVEHKKKGRLYLYTTEELEKMSKNNEIKLRADGSPEIMRFKGLGEMQSEQLGETALDHETRRLLQVKISDEAEAEDITTLLMGSRVDRRREYIEEHALAVEAEI